MTDDILIENAMGAGYYNWSTGEGVLTAGLGPDTPVLVFRDGPMSRFRLSLIFVNANFSTFQGYFVGSLDRINWFKIGASLFSASNSSLVWSYSFNGCPCSMVKVTSVSNDVYYGNSYTMRVTATSN